MAELIFDDYRNEENYSDGASVEDELFELVKSSEPYENSGNSSWPMLYHLSHLRENILNWYPFKKDCTVLEIGSGCGAITGLLCRNAKSVVSVELTKKRAAINYERHKQHENLLLRVGNFENMHFEEAFDYIVINGVFEYAEQFISGEEPHKKFLALVSSYLKDNGIMLLAIENRLGLKYFSGCKEDHIGKCFAGINGYHQGEKVRTFSKGELTEQIKQAGLYAIKYFYPYPDYKFPFEIFTDSTISTMLPKTVHYAFDAVRAKLFDEMEVYQSLMQENIIAHFANSFLVEIAKSQEMLANKLAYVKISANRKKQFQIFTYFDEDQKRVYKQALCPQSQAHIENMLLFRNYKKNNIENLQCVEEETGKVSFNYIDQLNYDDFIFESYTKGIDQFTAEVAHLRDSLYNGVQLRKNDSSAAFESVFGREGCSRALHWVENANVDLIADNIFLNNSTYTVIDYEWHLPCEVSMEFVIWRMVSQFVDNHSLDKYVTKPMVYTLLNMDEDTEKCFLSWNAHFVAQYVGIVDLFSLAKDVVPVDVDKTIESLLNETVIKSTMFFDVGDGFTNQDYVCSRASYTPSGFRVIFQTEQLKKSNRLRWDPVEGKACEIHIQDINTDGKVFAVQPINSEGTSVEGRFTFFTFDPQFEITGDFSTATYISVDFSCRILDWTQGYRRREAELLEQQRILKAHTEEKSRLILEVSTMQTALFSIQAELQSTQTVLLSTQAELIRTKDVLLKLKEYMNIHRMKSMLKVFLYGDFSKRNSEG